MRTTITTLIAAFLFFSCATAPAEQNNDESTPVKTKKENSVSNTSFSDGKYIVNGELSTCKWLGTEITTKTHNGSLNIYKGSAMVINNKVAHGFIAMDMNSIEVEDLSGAAKESLTGHLKSEDFFGVDKYPFAQLKLESVKTKDGKSYAGGRLNIRGIDNPISFPVVVTQDGNQLIFDGDMTFDRSQYDVKFRSGSFPDLFPDLGDKLINDEIVISFHIVAES